MKFLILRVLTHSELGMFHEYRRQGKEGSKQRAVNFDGDVVDRVFPAAQDTDRIEMNLRYDTDAGVADQTHFLTRQGKNWRLEGNCPRDRFYAFVEPGCLFAMEVDAGTSPATGSWVVFPGASEIAQAIRDDGATSGLARAGMIALHGDEGSRVQRLLHTARPDMFNRDGGTETSMTTPSNRVDGGRHLPPRPSRVAEIMGGTGHTFVSAVADIVDNSISADATLVEITFSPPDSGHGRWLTIADNGWGMTEGELDEAMTLGSDADYDDNSLGKYGYGLKGASWSQARVFTVVTRKRGGKTYHLSWDKKNLGNWVALDAPLEAWKADATTLGEQGTVVLWEDMTPPAAAPAARGVPPYVAEVLELQRHLGLVFHRFLEGSARNRKKVTLRINGKPVQPNNPVGHPLVEEFDLKSIKMMTEAGDAIVQVQPFLLPSEEEIRQHHKDDGPEAVNLALNRTGMYGKRNESQGLFIYRNDRLIKWGGWHQMWSTSDEKTKLARVVVNFGTKLDDSFKINITKMSVSLPGYLQDQIKKLANPVRNDSKAKYRKSGPTPEPVPTPTPTPPAGGPIDAPPSAGGGVSESPAAAPTPSQPEPPSQGPVTLRPVTTSRFVWKVTESLLGTREIQVSDLNPDLVAIAHRLGSDADAMKHLAGFLETLDRLEVQKSLLNPPSE